MTVAINSWTSKFTKKTGNLQYCVTVIIFSNQFYLGSEPPCPYRLQVQWTVMAHRGGSVGNHSCTNTVVLVVYTCGGGGRVQLPFSILLLLWIAVLPCRRRYKVKYGEADTIAKPCVLPRYRSHRLTARLPTSHENWCAARTES